MKALIYSDLQATDGHERCFSDPGQPLQLMRVRQFYAQLLDIYRREKCSCLWDLGDTTDDRSAVPIPAIDAVLEGLEAFPDDALNVKLIGNHEQYTRDTKQHLGRMFQSKFRVVGSTDTVELNRDTLLACASYPASDASLNEWLQATAYSFRGYTQKILLGHFQVSGCRLNSGTALTGADPLLLRKFTLCLLGHVHRPQTLGNAHYVGSPFQQNFGEKGEAKRVGVLDLQTLNLSWVPMTGFPEYYVLPFEDWRKAVRKGAEHRYQVLLATPEQSKAFYAHPLMAYAEPIYDYQAESAAQAPAARAQVWTQEALMSRYVSLNPPGSLGIKVSDDDMLFAGQTIAKG